MKNWNPLLKRALIPDYSLAQCVYRFPFYLNLICLGYLYFWYWFSGMKEYSRGLWDFSSFDQTGKASMIFMLGHLSWVFALLMLLLFGFKDRRRDYIGLVYLLGYFIFFVVLVDTSLD